MSAAYHLGTQKGHHYGHGKGSKPCSQKGYVREEDIEDEKFKSMEKILPVNEKLLEWYKKRKLIILLTFLDNELLLFLSG